jgi:hypothetical protein
MRNSTDPRIPVLLGGTPGPHDAVLLEAGQPAPAHGHVVPFNAATHPAGCLCCAPRSGAADALARLYRARVTGAAPFFDRVIVIASQAGEQAATAALATDVVSQARYKVAE